MRLSYEQQQYLRERFNTDRLWSYSRVSTYLEHPWEYRIVYVEKLTRSSNVYTHFGTICHDIIQDHYDGKYDYDKMQELYEDAILEWRMDNKGYTFMNKNIESGYVDNLADYFKNTEIVPYKVKNESPVCVNFWDEKRQKNVTFIGYLDSEYIDDEGIFNIVDYKSSSKSSFSGKKLKDASKQLKLYAIGIHQARGIPYEKIRLRYDLMKYYEVFYLQKNGKWKGSKQERAKWVASQEKKIRTILLDNDVDIFDIDEMVEMSIASNTIENLPDFVKEKFQLKNCYIDVTISEEEAKELEQLLVETVAEIEEKEAMDDLDEAFPEERIDETNEFYYTQLSPQVLKFNKGYQDKLAMMEVGRRLTPEQELDINSLFG